MPRAVYTIIIIKDHQKLKNDYLTEKGLLNHRSNIDYYPIFFQLPLLV